MDDEFFEDEIGGYCNPISDWEEYAESFIFPQRGVIMYELIKTFNTKTTHIEVDTLNQEENGGEVLYSYTVYLIDNMTSEPIDVVNIDDFSKSDIDYVKNNFKRRT